MTVDKIQKIREARDLLDDLSIRFVEIEEGCEAYKAALKVVTKKYEEHATELSRERRVTKKQIRQLTKYIRKLEDEIE